MGSTSAYIATEAQRSEWLGMFEKASLPFEATFNNDRKRSLPQNRTIHGWYGEIARHLGDVTPNQVRAMCKLEIGVPILQREDLDFREWYQGTIRPLDYAFKLALFERLDPAVTSKMSVKQLTEYMDAMQRRYLEAGVFLTIPEERAA